MTNNKLAGYAVIGKALVNQQSEATELLWVNQNADLPDLLHVYRNPAPERVLHGNRSQPH